MSFLWVKMLMKSNTIATQDPEADVTNGFVEDSYDAKQILLKSMIAEVGEENI